MTSVVGIAWKVAAISAIDSAGWSANRLPSRTSTSDAVNDTAPPRIDAAAVAACSDTPPGTIVPRTSVRVSSPRGVNGAPPGTTSGSSSPTTGNTTAVSAVSVTLPVGFVPSWPRLTTTSAPVAYSNRFT